MLELLKQRWQSRTYRVAVIGAVLTVLEVHYQPLSMFLPERYRIYVVLLFPVAMMLMREVTKIPLSDK
jgi:hypothetical protein